MTLGTINVIGSNSTAWEELLKFRRNQKFNYIFSNNPVEADFHVFFSFVRSISFRGNFERIAFVISEPPEVMRYPKKFLDQFSAVFSPRFDYLQSAHNFVFAEGMLPFHVGFDTQKSGKQMRSLNDIREERVPKKYLISVIQSRKNMTLIQKLRLDFIKKLKRDLPELEIFGAGTNPVLDKADVLLASKFTISIENSVHEGYWTEKLIDPILCRCVPIYFGDPNILNSFSSPVIIDIYNYRSSLKEILKTLNNEESMIRLDSDFSKYLNHNIFNYLETWASLNSKGSKKFSNLYLAKPKSNLPVFRKFLA